MMTRLATSVVASLVAASAALSSPQAHAAASAASVPTFEAGKQTNDLDRHDGSEWPDELEIVSAFENQFERFDACVADEKKRRRSAKRLAGEAAVQVLLNPAGHVPLGLNTSMPKPYTKRKQFVACLRTAAAQAPFPAYDGPPLVVDFEFELDPGYDIVADD
ncbi:MAG: hypothetical protein B7733_12060 [Myxococcales bacterium FL481]|nr:MAG: hypothetical protein B7733_12060 [Myxococcales bacterium FL481]